MTTAQKVREHKAKNPERYCRYPGCLWLTIHRDGTVTPCPKHPQ